MNLICPTKYKKLMFLSKAILFNFQVKAHNTKLGACPTGSKSCMQLFMDIGIEVSDKMNVQCQFQLEPPQIELDITPPWSKTMFGVFLRCTSASAHFYFFMIKVSTYVT